MKNVDTVNNVMKALRTSHHGFPVVNQLGNIVGLIPRNFILTILENRAFYMNTNVQTKISEFARETQLNLATRNTNLKNENGVNTLQKSAKRVMTKEFIDRTNTIT